MPTFVLFFCSFSTDQDFTSLCISETSSQNGCYPFTLQENILLLNAMGNIRMTSAPLSMLFATSVGLFNSGIKRQVLGMNPVQTPMPCCGKLSPSGSAAARANLHLPQERISEADGVVLKKNLCNLTHIFAVGWVALEFNFWGNFIYILPVAWPECFLKFSQLC